MKSYKKKLYDAAKQADWWQVVCNEGPPCFHLETDALGNTKFCLRAERWQGHGVKDFHNYVPLHELLGAALYHPETLKQLGRLTDRKEP